VTAAVGLEERARASGGASNAEALYETVRHLIAARDVPRGVLVDVGCGSGRLHAVLAADVERYIGVDVVQYEGYPAGPNVDFRRADLDAARIDLPDGCADVVCSLETIEHVENARALMRELVRLARPGGLLVITTPNQISALSKACFVAKNEFVHFQDRPGLYPSHLSALLPIDLLRMARENGLDEAEVTYSGEGRMPLTGLHWPRWLTGRHGWRGRAFSDNVLLCARRRIDTRPT
jgi:2-polyprenyl-3-methyl-5-hydroxy-6-metoxy-1,4-benzoquinol methylase